MAAAEHAHIPVRASDTYEGLSVNVKDFGAKGDGRTDDTEAIRAAVKAAYERRRIPQHPDYGYFVSFAEVYFPSGHYIISDTIDISWVKISGENYAAVEQKDPEKDLFHGTAWRTIIEGMSFLGGKTHLNLGNPNTDTGHVKITDCHFKNSSDIALQMREGSNSTFFKVIDCEQAIISYTDMTTIRDTWISTSRKMKDKAAIVNSRGVMHIDNLLGVPRVRRGAEGFSVEWEDPNGRIRTASNQRWIDNHGVLHARNSRFGGEGGGFPAVYNFARYNPHGSYHSSVTIESSYLYNAQDTAVVLKEIPNILTVFNCNGLPDAWLVRIDKSIDLDTHLETDGRPHDIRITLNANYGGFGHGLPEQLLPYLQGEIVAKQPPLKGRWNRGQFIRNLNADRYYDQQAGWVNVTTPALQEPFGWYCTQSGRPGTWIPVFWFTDIHEAQEQEE